MFGTFTNVTSIQTCLNVDLKALVLNNNNISLVHDLGKLKNLNTLGKYSI